MDKRETERRAMRRGEKIRGELLTYLEQGPHKPGDLWRQIDRQADVSLPEVVFQLGRLEGEYGAVVRDQGDRYRLA